MTTWTVFKERYYGEWVGDPRKGGWLDETVGKPRKILNEYTFKDRSEARKKWEQLKPTYGKTYFDEVKMAEIDKFGDIIDYVAIKDPDEHRG